MIYVKNVIFAISQWKKLGLLCFVILFRVLMSDVLKKGEEDNQTILHKEATILTISFTKLENYFLLFKEKKRPNHT